MSRTGIQIKVCGIRDPQNLEQLCSLAPDFVGFIFYPRSKRYVGEHPDPALFRIPGPGIKKTGVFVDEQVERLKEAIGLYGLDAVQLHGSESADYCRQISGEGVQVIKVLDPLAPEKDPESYGEVADFLLFDSAGAGSGGSGRKFDWRLLEDRPFHAPFFLSGGIGPEDAGPLRLLDLRGFTGVDVNSRFELSPGIKDMERLKEFFTEIKK
jgi:phosphoribosylanthranilate isomerase